MNNVMLVQSFHAQKLKNDIYSGVYATCRYTHQLRNIKLGI